MSADDLILISGFIGAVSIILFVVGMIADRVQKIINRRNGLR